MAKSPEGGFKMVAQRTRQVEPLCRFGPGGDYEVTWQPEPEEVFEMSNRTLRLLSAVLEVLAVVLGFKNTDAAVEWRNAARRGGIIDFDRERMKNAAENSTCRNTAHAPAVAVADDGGAISGEQMLFPYVGRDGVGTEPKPKHGIRTYRRAAKKRSAVRFAKQGSLFEAQLKSAKTA